MRVAGDATGMYWAHRRTISAAEQHRPHNRIRGRFRRGALYISSAVHKSMAGVPEAVKKTFL
jgi:hypothetical protein